VEDYYALAAHVCERPETLSLEIIRDCTAVYHVERPEDLSWDQLDEACRRLELSIKYWFAVDHNWWPGQPIMSLDDPAHPDRDVPI
jgi:hypothetical protein